MCGSGVMNSMLGSVGGCFFVKRPELSLLSVASMLVEREVFVVLMLS